MKRIKSLLWLSKKELLAEADAADRLASDLRLLAVHGNLPESSLQDVPTFLTGLYISKSVDVCFGLLQEPGETTDRMASSNEIVVDGRHLGWVLTRRGAFRVIEQYGMYMGIEGGQSLGLRPL